MALLETVKLRPHQVEGVSYMLKHNYVYNAYEQGLGKTLQAIMVQQSEDFNCLIICPATAKYSWAIEYEKFTDEKSVNIGHDPEAKVNITNYENLYLCTELFMKSDLVIFDEAHYLVNMESQRSQYAHRFIRKYKPQRLILLSGTPMKERIPNLYSPLKLLSYSPIRNNGRDITEKFKTQDSFSRYFSHKKTFKVKVQGRRGGSFMKEITKYEGVRNTRELEAYLKYKYIRKTAREVEDLPPIVYKDVYANYAKDFQLQDQLDKINSGKRFDTKVKAEAAYACSGFTANYVKDLLDSGNSPIIVFSDHLDPLDNIASSLKRKARRYRCEFIIGETSGEDRKRFIKEFELGKIDVLLCTYGAAATAITLIRSNNMVLNDETWEASSMSQAIKRFHRIGQNRTCFVHRVVGGKISKKISDIVHKKQKYIDEII